VYKVGQVGFDVGVISAVKSLNAQDPSETPVFEQLGDVDLGGPLGERDGPNPVGLLGQAWIATDHSDGRTRGNVYVLASVDLPGPDPLDVMFRRSTDGGLTFSDAVRVNNDPTGSNAWQWFATMAVAPNGRIDVVWNDTRNTGQDNLCELFYASSVDTGMTWTGNIAVSPVFDSHVGWPQQPKLGDYYDMISDVDGTSIAYAATFNGEQDVYFLRIEADCNGNGITDTTDVTGGTSEDCNSNLIPDECERDCNANDVPDECDVTGGTSDDCNGNYVPDECDPDCNENDVPDDCDITGGTSDDCNNNGIPDECIADEIDCNGNNVPDECDITGGTSDDCNNNGIPDECIADEIDCNGNNVPDECDITGGTSPDCNENGVPDECDVTAGTSEDCNTNNIPDECDIADGTSLDCDGSGVPDECEPPQPDCNENGVGDGCDLADGTSRDCNHNGVLDECDIRDGTSDDVNGDGVPDECLLNDDCRDAEVICEGITVDPDLGRCDDSGVGPPGPICSVSQQDCFGGSTCIPWPGDSYRCTVETDNTGAWTGGPPAGGDCADSGPDSFQADVWFQVASPCRWHGELVISMCHTAVIYDAMLAVFGDHSADPLCPGDSNEHLLVCNDDGCYQMATLSTVRTQVLEGGVYLVRVGGWDGDQGQSELDIGFLCAPPPAPPSDPQHRAEKHRYLSIDPSTHAPNNVAIKVEVAEMRRCQGDPRRSCLEDADCRAACENDLDKFCTTPSQCGGANCLEIGPCVDMAPARDRSSSGQASLSWFVQEPFQVPEGCLPGNVCGDDDWIARVDSAVYSDDWAEYSLLHIGDCEIVPCTTYALYACDPADITQCSTPLMVSTQVMPWRTPRDFGDVSGTITPDLEMPPPDGYVGVTDIQNWLFTSLNYGTADKPQSHPTWMDLHGLGTGIPPNYILNIGDFQLLYVFGFVYGVPWENTVGGLQPGDCP
jgi:hypothetical protein